MENSGRAALHEHRLAAVPRDLELPEAGHLELRPALPADEEDIEVVDVLDLGAFPRAAPGCRAERRHPDPEDDEPDADRGERDGDVHGAEVCIGEVARRGIASSLPRGLATPHPRAYHHGVVRRILLLPPRRWLPFAVACAGLSLLAGFLPSAAARTTTPVGDVGVPRPPGDGLSTVVVPDFRVRWEAIAPVPLSTQRAMTFTFRTSGAQAGGRVLARIATLDGTPVRELNSGSDPLAPIATLRWDGRDDAGRRVANGVYAVQLVALSRVGEEHPTSVRRVRLERPGRTRTVYRVNGAGRRVALTFDDCNFDDAWRRILTTLEERDVQVTFFCLGKTVQLFPQLARRTVALGHDIGSHSFDHPNLRYASSWRILDELDRTTRSWWSVAGVTPLPYFRPPYGDFDADVLRATGLRGYADCFLWDVDPSDWTDPGPGTIAARVLDRVRPGSIVLLHVKPQTAAALPAILRGLRKLDLEPVTLTELLAAGAPVTTGTVGLPY